MSLSDSNEMQQNPITFHKSTVADAATLTDYRILFAIELSGAQPQEAIDKLKEQMVDFFVRSTADDSCISFIAKCEGQVAGIGSVVFREQPGNFKNPSGKWGYIMNMYTVPQFRKKGICTAILNLLIEEGTKKGVKAFELHATKEGEPVYVREGFIHHTEPTLRKWI